MRFKNSRKCTLCRTPDFSRIVQEKSRPQKAGTRKTFRRNSSRNIKKKLCLRTKAFTPEMRGGRNGKIRILPAFRKRSEFCKTLFVNRKSFFTKTGNSKIDERIQNQRKAFFFFWKNLSKPLNILFLYGKIVPAQIRIRFNI